MKIPPGANSVFNSDSSVIVDISSTFVTISICIIGVSVSVLLKHWIMDNQRISRLENEKLQSEVEQLKDQITPDFLSKILKRTSILTKDDPKKTSLILMKLSMILRYQLYDCNMDKVLLNSEVNFIRNYLNLEQLCSNNFEFDVEVKGNIGQTTLPPLLFIPFIQSNINDLSDKEENVPKILVRFQVIDNILYFLCSNVKENFLDNSQLSNIKRRLNFLFPDRYSLNIVDRDTVKLELNLK